MFSELSTTHLIVEQMEKKCPLSLEIVSTACKAKRKACFYLRDKKLFALSCRIFSGYGGHGNNSEENTKCFLELLCYMQIKDVIVIV